MEEQPSVVGTPAFASSTDCGELFAALATAQKEIVGAVKDSNNPFFKSKYADLSAVWDACHGPLNTNGISIIQLPSSDPKTPDIVTVTTVLGHKSGQWISSSLSVRPTKADAQGMGSAISYARRYTMAAIAGVAYIEDDDGNAASKPINKSSSTKQPLVPTPPTETATPVDRVSQQQLDELVVFCQDNKIERETVRLRAQQDFGEAVSNLTQQQFKELKAALMPKKMFEIVEN